MNVKKYLILLVFGTLLLGGPLSVCAAPFDLGSGLTGTIQVPEEEGHHPIIFILPDEGMPPGWYPELLAGLAGLEALVITLDQPERFDDYQKAIKEAVEGGNHVFGQPLTDKGNLSEGMLITFGEKADLAFEVLDRHHEKQMAFLGAVLAAPKRTKEVLDVGTVQIPLAFLLPPRLWDENAVSLTMFQKLRLDSSRCSAATMVYLLEADPVLKKSPLSKPEAFPPPGLPSPPTFPAFTGRYSKDFILACKKQGGSDLGIDPLQPGPQELFGIPVKTSLLSSGCQSLVDAKLNPDPHLNCLGGQNWFDGLKMDHFKGLVDRYRISLAGGAGTFNIGIPGPLQDLSDFGGLSVRLSYPDKAGTPLKFRIGLEDVEGQSCFWEVETRPLPYLVEAAIPFFHERVIFEELMAVDLTSVKRIIFQFHGEGVFDLGDVALIPCAEPHQDPL